MKQLWLIVLVLAVPIAPVLAQEEPVTAHDEEVDPREIREAEMQQAFRSGMAGIVAELNRGSFSRYAASIDQDDLFDRIFGLRLISQRLKRDWREDQEQRFEDFIAGLYFNETKDGLKASLINVESRGNQGRAIVRFDMTFFRVNYVEFELRLDSRDRLIIVDWIDYYWGHRFTDYAGLMLVAAHPNENAVRKLIDYPSVSSQDVFEMTELLKAGRDLNLERYFTIFDRTKPRLQRQWFVLKLGIDATRLRRKRRDQRVVLEHIAEHFPEEPVFTLALLDYYVPTEQFEQARAGLVRLQEHLSIDDAMMNARLSSIELVMGNSAEAEVLALKAVEQEADLELGWWSLLRVKAAMEQYDEAVRALDTLTREFGHSLGPDTLRKDADFRGLVQSAEYREWIEGQS